MPLPVAEEGILRALPRSKQRATIGACTVLGTAKRPFRDNPKVVGSSPSPATTSEQVTLVPIFLYKKISHPLHCSSFFVKGHVQVGYSLVNALITPWFYYQPFTSMPSAQDSIQTIRIFHKKTPL